MCVNNGVNAIDILTLFFFSVKIAKAIKTFLWTLYKNVKIGVRHRVWWYSVSLICDLFLVWNASAAATGPAYPAAQQSGYAVAPAAYGAQRTGYDQATYQAAQGTYAGMN